MRIEIRSAIFLNSINKLHCAIGLLVVLYILFCMFYYFAVALPLVYFLIMTANDNRLPLLYIEQKLEKPTASLIFLHGLGKTGEWQKQQFYDLMGDNTKLPHIKMIFPTSQYVRCTHKDSRTYSWFDFKAEKDHARETFQILQGTVNSTLDYVDQLVKDEIESGISPDRIIVGGVSQGALVALMYGYTRETNIKGVMSLSGFYPQCQEKLFRTDNHLPLLYYANFDGDHVIPYKTSKGGADFLATKPIITESHVYKSECHEINKEMLVDAYKWIEKVIPN